jgi:serine/threonine-protein kinase HipA
MPAGAHPIMTQVTEAIEGRARALLTGLAEDASAAADSALAKGRGTRTSPARSSRR